MVFKASGLAGTKENFKKLETILNKLGFVRWTWDYDHATYDLRFDDIPNNKTYYLRMKANCIQGRLESPRAVVELEDPFMGRHIIHKGVDYDAEIPPTFVETAEKVIEKVKEQLKIS